MGNTYLLYLKPIQIQAVFTVFGLETEDTYRLYCISLYLKQTQIQLYFIVFGRQPIVFPIQPGLQYVTDS